MKKEKRLIPGIPNRITRLPGLGVFGQSLSTSRRCRLSLAAREEIAQALAALMPDDQNERTYAEVIAAMVCTEAAKGNVIAARELADRTEGRPKQAVDLNANINDWRELARANGLNEADVLNEAKRIIESAFDSSGAESD